MFTVERVAICLLLLDPVDCTWRQCLAQILYQVFLAKPDVEHSWRYLNMILQAIGSMANTKRLIGGGLAGGESDCSPGEIKDVFMPVYDLRVTW